MINFVYFGCGRVGSIPKASINDLVPFTDDNVKILKLDKIKSAKLKNPFKVANDYMQEISYCQVPETLIARTL